MNVCPTCRRPIDATDPTPADDRPYIDDAAGVLCWQGRQCPMGGLALAVCRQLLRRGGHYTGRDELIWRTWGKQGVRVVTDDNLRQVIHRVREQLRAAGMQDLADRIEARNGRYRLAFWPEPVVSQKQSQLP